MSANFNDTTPAAPGGRQNVTWQKDTSGNISASIPTPVTAVTSVSGTAPIASSGGTTPAISIANFTGDTGTGGAAGAVPAPPAGSAAAGKFLKADGTFAVPSGTATGTVTSVGLTAPADLTVTGSPVTGSGTIAITRTTQSANQVMAGPTSGAAATPTYRALVAADIPAIPESGVTNLVADLAAKAPLASPALTGTPTAPTAATADNSTTLATTAFVKAQGYGTASGTVTSVGLTAPAWLAVTGSPVTGSGTLALAAATGQTANLLLATPDGATGAVGLRALVPGDFLSVPLYVGCSLVGSPVVSQVVALVGMPIKGQFAANFSGSVGSVGTNPAATAAYTVKIGSTTIGTISISTGGVFTFATTGAAIQSFNAGDRLTIVAPSPADTTLADVSITLKATRT